MAITKKKGTNKKTGLCKPAISGDMTIYTAETLKSDLDDIINDYGRFEFDLSEVEEIDTSGIQILMAFSNAVRNKGDAFIIKNSNEEVDSALNRYHLTSKLCEEV